MAIVKFSHSGGFDKTEAFLKNATKKRIAAILQRFGAEGVAALSAATPFLTGATASAWTFKVESSGLSGTVEWSNAHVNKGVPIAIILQYGHGTGTGGYVAGRDYINPAIRPIFDSLADAILKEVNS